MMVVVFSATVHNWHVAVVQSSVNPGTWWESASTERRLISTIVHDTHLSIYVSTAVDATQNTDEYKHSLTVPKSHIHVP